MSSVVAEYNVLLVGNPGAGKTSFINRHRTATFSTKYHPTTEMSVHSLNFHTSAGKVVLNMWEVSDHLSDTMREKCYAGADAAIIMYDVISRISYDAVKHHDDQIYHTCDRIPTVIIGNKHDVFDGVITSKTGLHPTLNLKYYEVSVKANFECMEPVLEIIKILMADQNITLLDRPTAM